MTVTWQAAVQTGETIRERRGGRKVSYGLPIALTLLAAVLQTVFLGMRMAEESGSEALAGVQVAGKTGTAQSAPNRPPYAWFVSFAPADNPQVAVAVLVQDAGVDRNSVTGNGLAAPIARALMQAVIQ